MGPHPLLSYETLVHATSGAVGSVVAMSTFFPLDTIRTRLQVDDKMKSKNSFVLMSQLIEEEGFDTLYRGIVPVLQSLCASNFVYFYTFHGLKRMVYEADIKQQSALKDLLLGCIAGIINVLSTTPLWVVNTRLKMQGLKLNHGEGVGINGHQQRLKYKGLLDGLLYIGQTEGVGGLWAGTLSSLILVLNPAIQFMTYESLKRRLHVYMETDNAGVLAYFVVGAIAKAIATVLTYPIQLVQAKQRHGHNFPDLAKTAGVMDMTFYILKKQGAKGLFKGLEAKVLQTVLTTALMFMTYEKIAAFIFNLMLTKKHKVH